MEEGMKKGKKIVELERRKKERKVKVEVNEYKGMETRMEERRSKHCKGGKGMKENGRGQGGEKSGWQRENNK